METFLSLICLWPVSWAPKFWALCNGALLDINQNTALYSLLGTNYGGNDVSNFGIPDFRGRVPVGAGHGPLTSNYILGQMGGYEDITLASSQLPVHTHAATFNPTSVTLKASPVAGTEKVPGTNDATTLAASDQGRSDASNIYNAEEPTVDLNMDASFAGTVIVADAGASQAHDNIQPYTTVNYIIALEGIYPSRS